MHVKLRHLLFLQHRRWKRFSLRQTLRPRMLTNLALNLWECRRGRSRLRSYPWNIVVELTANCNLKCSMCPVGIAGWDASKEMPWELFTAIGRQLFPIACVVDLRSQGESTIARHWQDALEFIRPYRAQFRITTNGMKLVPKLCDRLARQQMSVTVSFDAAQRETFERLREGSDFDRICNNIRELAAAQRRHRNPVRNLALRMTLQRDNLGEIPDVIRLARDMGVRVVHLQPVDTDGDEREVRHYPELARKQIERALELGEELGMVEVEVPSFAHLFDQSDCAFNKGEENTPVSSSQLDTFCNDPWKTVNIAHDGKVFACCYGNMPYLGDLRQASFDAIWNGERYRDLRARVNSNRPWPECRVCYPKNRFG